MIYISLNRKKNTMCRIIGLYSTFIILIAQIVRDLFLGSPANIMFNELPNVDRLLQLLDDILLVRSFIYLDLEAELYDKLIAVYRNPRLLIEMTRDERDLAARRHRRRFNMHRSSFITSSRRHLDSNNSTSDTEKNSNSSGRLNQENKSIIKLRL